MNVNERITHQHVEYESQAYMYAFTIELEISAAAMWCFVGHLKPTVSIEFLNPVDYLRDFIFLICFSIHQRN